MLIKNYLILILLGYLLTFNIIHIEALKCGKGALNPNGQQNNVEFYNSSGKKIAALKGIACRFNKDGILQITAEKTYTVFDSSSLGKWVDGEVRYLNVKKTEKNKRFFITKNKKTAWIKDQPKPTTKPNEQFKCKDGKKPIDCKITILSYAYGGAVGNYEGKGCMLHDDTGSEYWEFKDIMSFYDPDRKGRWFNGDIWYEHIKPTKKQEGIQLNLSSDGKTLKIRS